MHIREHVVAVIENKRIALSARTVCYDPPSHSTLALRLNPTELSMIHS
jgi:hypothetical protein